MKDLKEFISVEINEPIKCQVRIDGKNDFMDVDTIYLKAFNVKEHKNITLPLRNKYKRMQLSNLALFNKILDEKEVESPKKTSKVEKEDSDNELTESILSGLTVSDPNELLSFYGKFKEFLGMNICYVDESFNNKFTTVNLENLDTDDLEKIIASYIANFFFRSWMK